MPVNLENQTMIDDVNTAVESINRVLVYVQATLPSNSSNTFAITAAKSLLETVSNVTIAGVEAVSKNNDFIPWPPLAA